MLSLSCFVCGMAFFLFFFFFPWVLLIILTKEIFGNTLVSLIRYLKLKKGGSYLPIQMLPPSLFPSAVKIHQNPGNFSAVRRELFFLQLSRATGAQCSHGPLHQLLFGALSLQDPTQEMKRTFPACLLLEAAVCSCAKH